MKDYQGLLGSLAVGLLLLLLLLGAPMAARAVAGTVHLKNGGWVEGDVLEVLPDDHVTVRLVDGTARQIAWVEVDHVEQAPPPAQSTASASPAPVDTPPTAPPPPTTPPPSAVVPAPAAAPAPSPAAEPPLAVPASAHEQNHATQPVFALLGVLGFGGETAGDASGTDNGQAVTSAGSVDLEPSYGFGAQIEFPLHANFSLGALARFLWWANEQASRRIMFFDATAVPRFRYPFGSGEGWGVLFLQVPIGIGAVDPPTPDPSFVAALDSYQHDVSAAFVVGVDAGVEVFASDNIGFVLTAGWLHHAFTEDLSVTIGDQTFAQSSDLHTGQFTLHAGLGFGL